MESCVGLRGGYVARQLREAGLRAGGLRGGGFCVGKSYLMEFNFKFSPL